MCVCNFAAATNRAGEKARYVNCGFVNIMCIVHDYVGI